jgi:hypothetical protein
MVKDKSDGRTSKFTFSGVVQKHPTSDRSGRKTPIRRPNRFAVSLTVEMRTLPQVTSGGPSGSYLKNLRVIRFVLE